VITQSVGDFVPRGPLGRSEFTIAKGMDAT